MRWPDGRMGWTRDISPDGLYVHLSGHQPVASWCALEIDFTPARLRLRALAQVLRIEPGADDLGVALRLHQMRFHALP